MQVEKSQRKMGWHATAKKGKTSQMKVVEDFESRPHKAVSFVVERGKETGME